MSGHSSSRCATSNPEGRDHCDILGIPVDNLTLSEAVDRISEMISRGGQHYAVVVNAAKAVVADRDDALRQVLLGADLITADGMSVVWASRMLGTPLKERVAGIDLCERLVERAASRNLSAFFLGASDQSVRGTVEHFLSRHPALRVAGFRDGYFPPAEAGEVADTIKRSGADLLFVALGSPAQERWIATWLGRTGARFALGVGGSFDHFSGRARRAPLWMRGAGLEWLYRLLSEPRRLWKRYLIGNIAFAWLVFRQKLFTRRG